MIGHQQSLGPCDHQDPLWVKMSAVTNVANVISKKRRKSDSKPQSQINKCLNEKRRREQENIHFEELAELISASISDMNSQSNKPDKCAILQETVNQIKKIKEQESEHCDAVQQSDVSSSKPNILGSDLLLGPLLLEALDGFVFAVNTEGKIEFVSENVASFIKYSRDDLCGESIYNIIHIGDHTRFSSALLPASIGWITDPNSQSKSRSFNCRLLVKPAPRQGETMEESQQRVSQYENMQVSALLFPRPTERVEHNSSETESEAQKCLVCVARRIPPNEKNSNSTVEQFTTRLDVTGKITAVDTSGVSSTYSQYLNKDLVGRLIIEMCHPTEQQKLAQHLKDALQSGSCTSGIYRFRLTQEKYIHVQTKSTKFSHGAVNREPEFIMSIHSIIGDSEIGGSSESNGSASGSMSPASVLGAPNSSVASTSLAPIPSPMMTAAAMGGGSSLSMGNVGTDIGVSASSSTMGGGGGGGISNSSGTNGSGGNSNNSAPSLNNFSVTTDLDFSSLEMFQNASSWEVGSNDANIDSVSDVGFSASSSRISPAISTVAHTMGSMSTVAAWSNGRPVSRPSASVPTSNAPTAVSVGYDSGIVSHSPVNPLNSRGSATPPTSFTNSFQFSPLPEPSSVSDGDRIARSPASGRTAGAMASDGDKKSQAEDAVASSSSPAMSGACETTTGGGGPDPQQQAAVKLRQLLTQRDDEEPSSVMMSLGMDDDDEQRGDASHNSVEAAKESKGENTILKGLLHQDDEDFDDLETDHQRAMDGKSAIASSSHNPNLMKEMHGGGGGVENEGPKKPAPSNDVLLRSLLKEKDGDSDRVQPSKRTNEFLHHLLEMQQQQQQEMESNLEHEDPESLLRQLVLNPQQGGVAGYQGHVALVRQLQHQQQLQHQHQQQLQQQHQQQQQHDHQRSMKRKMGLEHEADSMGEPSMPAKHANMQPANSSVVYNNKMLLDLLNKDSNAKDPPALLETRNLVTQRPQDKLPKDIRGRIVKDFPSQHPRLQQLPMAPQKQQPQPPMRLMPMGREAIPSEGGGGGHTGMQMSGGGGHTGMQMSGGRITISSSVPTAPLNSSAPPPQPNRTSVYLSDLLNQPLRHDVSQMGQLHSSTMTSSLPTQTVTTTMAAITASAVSRGAGGMESPDSLGGAPRYPPTSASHSLMDFVADTSTPPATSTGSDHSDIISDIVQQVMEMQSELSIMPSESDSTLANLLLCDVGSNNVSTSSQDETMAINAIQKHLMSCENQNLSPSMNVPQQLPPYSSSQMPPSPNMVSSAPLQPYQNHPPPPVYQGGHPHPSQSPTPGSYPQRVRFVSQPPNAVSLQMGGIQRPAGTQYGVAPNVALAGLVPGGSQQQQQHHHQQQQQQHQVRQTLTMQRRQKHGLPPQAQNVGPRRMLSSQQLLMQATQGHSSPGGLPEQLSPTGYDNVADLLNPPVAAPNVTLQVRGALSPSDSNSNHSPWHQLNSTYPFMAQRSTSVPDSQLSPVYGGNLLGQQAPPQPSQISPGARMGPSQQPPYSPHSQMASPLGGQQPYPPHATQMGTFSPQGQQQARLSPHPQATMPYSQQQSAHSQLSPRIATPHQQPPFPSQLSPQPTSNAGQTQPTWTQVASRGGPNIQQQNPMLNAQLNKYLLSQEGDHNNAVPVQVQMQQPQQQQAPSYPTQVRFQQMPRQQIPPGGGGGAVARSMSSPGTPGQGPHQSPFSDQQQFSQASLHSGGASPQVALYQQQQQQQQQQQVRMQRAISVPGQMPGRVNSPRAPHFANTSDPLLSPGGPQMSPSFPNSGLVQSQYSAPPPQSAPPPSYGASGMGTPHPEQTHFPFDQQSLQVYGNNAGPQMDRSRTGVTEYTRQELRNMVGARTQQQQQQQQGQGQQHLSQGHQQSMGGPPSSSMTQSEIDNLALHLDLPTGDGDMGGPGSSNPGNRQGQSHGAGASNSRMLEESRPTEHSLLQKLLSE